MSELDQTTAPTHDGGIKALIAEEGALIREAHFNGADGGDVVQRRTGLIDKILREVYGRLAASGPLPALLAVGGYGRGELNPYSDIDIMFLCRSETDRQRSPEMLYVLWDAGLDVGYSVRTIEECKALAREDIKIRTSLLESRLIAGDPALYDSFLGVMRSEVFYWKSSAFITEKLSDRNATRRKFGDSLYLREPNIKDGDGGLRDFHTALWISFVHFRIASLAELVTKGIISKDQYAVFVRSRNFLWRVRNEIHYLSGRKNDHLTFDLQERAARDFRYRDSTHLLAVERFMKTYYLHARNIREFSSIVAEAVLRKPVGRWFERSVPLGQFKLIGRTLVSSSEDVCKKDPALIMTAFQIAQERHALFSDKLTSQIKSCHVSEEARASAAAAKAFLSILNNLEGLGEILTLMKDLRFLGRYIPEFRAIQALAKHDYYHKYTVDEHILLAIRNLQNLWSGNYPGLAALFDALKSLPNRWVLILAVLLHDLGKAYRYGHEHEGVELAQRVLARLGIAGKDHERILFLIKNHLVMANLSQRRELTDQKVILDFSRLVQDRETLAMLYLLTYADISAVNPTAWTQWRATLLQELYLKTLKYLESSAQAIEGEKARLMTAFGKIREAAVPQFSPDEIDDFLTSMSTQYVVTTPVYKVIDHLKMVKRIPDEQLVIQYRHYPEKGYTELTICAYDAYGMFYRTAGTIALKKLNILRAQVYTSKKGVMIDTFQITDHEGNLCSYEEAWKRVTIDLRAALTGGFRPPEPGAFASSRALPGMVTTSVEFDNETSDAFTIIDITARDRVGFLYAVTKTLYDLNLDVGSAKIVTEGSRVMDSFYITDLLKKKITERERLDKIQSELLRVIE